MEISNFQILFCLIIYFFIGLVHSNNLISTIEVTTPYSAFSNVSRVKRDNLSLEARQPFPPVETNQIFHVTPNDDSTGASGPSWSERLFGTLVEHFMLMFSRQQESLEPPKDNSLTRKNVEKDENLLATSARVFEASQAKSILAKARVKDIEEDDEEEDSEEDSGEKNNHLASKVDKLLVFNSLKEKSELNEEQDIVQHQAVCHMLNSSIGHCQPTLHCMMQQPDQQKFAICESSQDGKEGNLEDVDVMASNRVLDQTRLISSNLPARVCCPAITISEKELKKKIKDWLTEAKSDLYTTGLPENPDGRCGAVLVDQIQASNEELFRTNFSINPTPEPNKRIVHGKAVKDGEVPWMAQIFYQSQLICGGAIISKLHILTAAHCFSQSNNPVDYVVLYGNVKAANGTSVLVSSIKVHPRYRPPAIYGDLAMMTLVQEIEFDEFVQPVCLPGKKMINKLMVGQTAVVTGFGDVRFQGPPAHQLQKVNVKIIESAFCERNYHRLVESDKRFPNGIGSSLICAGWKRGKRDACQGDSGGPLTVSYHSANYLVGIVSFGYRCALPRYPGIYTAVAYYNNWIFDNISTL